MKKFQFCKRIMSFVLAMTLVFLGPTVAYAQEHDLSAIVASTDQTNTQVDSNKENNSSVVDSEAANQTAGEAEQADTAESTSDKDKASESTKNDKADTSSENTSDEATNSTEDTEDKEDKLNDKDDDKETSSSDKNLKEDKEDEEDCEHTEYEYKANEDGTHVKTCKECGEEVTEDCDFDDEGICKLCGFEQPEEEQEDKIFEIKVNDFIIKAEVPAGTFDEDVEFIAEEINLSSKEKELVNDTVSLGEVENLYAFDLRFEFNGKEIEPKEGYNVKISIESSTIDTDVVVHIKDDATAETVDSEITEDKVSFESDSFSKYALAGINGQHVLYKESAYGSAYTDQRHTEQNSSIASGGFGDNRIAVRMFQKNEYGIDYYTDKEFAPKEIAPANNNDCFIYSPSVYDNFTFTFEAPENYYIAKVQLFEIYDDSSDNFKNAVKTFIPQENEKYNYSVSMTLNRMHYWNKVTNAVVIDLEPITATLNMKKYTEVRANLVNYKNGNLTGDSDKNAKKYFGDNFAFSSGRIDPDSNHCRYPQVYQGLAKNDISSDGVFRLSNGNDKVIFPEKKDYEKAPWSYNEYIDEYYGDTPVQFNLDEDGYWTLDSRQYKYIYKDNGIRPISTSNKKQNQFRPFKDKNGNYEDSHFGMLLPINFSVAQNGLTNGKDTIFKFSGDDDVFVYVDGKLVLDLGGIHDIVKGQINFTTGEVLIQGDYANELTASWNDSVYYKKGIGTTNLYDIIPENNVLELSQKEHVLTVAYFERGAHLSNCKISYNFKKTETRTADFSGLKVDENGDGLAGAEFTLYTDEQCTQVATIGIGKPAVAVSDASGTISFTGLSAGVIEDGQDSVQKTYYLKETQAPEGYNLPDNAIWQLDFTVFKNTKKEPIRKLTALNDAAKALSLDNNGNQTSVDVKAIENVLTKQPKKLSVVKTVTYGSDAYTDADAQYTFKLVEIVTKYVDVYIPMANQPYTVNGHLFTTDSNGQFVLKANEMAVFENLYESRYQVIEEGIVSNEGYTLDNYETRISIDGNVEVNRVANVTYDTNKEKTVQFENILNKVFDWQLIKVSTSGKSLRGAEFTLTSEDKKTTYYGSSDENGLVKWYGSENDMASGSNPVVIPDGSYILSETKAPSGFAKSNDSWHIILDKKDGLTAYMSNKGDLKDRTVVENQNLANGVTLKMVKLSFVNQVAYTLPETGGSGTYIFTISGVLAMLWAALLLYKTRSIKK
ncbi:LPXTG-motif cell wall anchor domain-containing protein/fibro-slime domain-containing protein [Pseudobutyrivibrio sp. YE44]|uniref:MSCRAMM family protein n=1 Tax=Pseudobutyrivibrio sp. YE44 TaxID=1520802 RepID=UPI000885CADA|nr:SpaA isopeptide-forming pilin-related protein [Pseudobutyrivibrio sp. YE44]SDB34864.1 LPXTG-motif cell wall anchor domain-containing protein/fibro-slime domain-containing protein [Pseudobutyrivibrio sp. YE44]